MDDEAADTSLDSGTSQDGYKGKHNSLDERLNILGLKGVLV